VKPNQPPPAPPHTSSTPRPYTPQTRAASAQNAHRRGPTGRPAADGRCWARKRPTDRWPCAPQNSRPPRPPSLAPPRPVRARGLAPSMPRSTGRPQPGAPPGARSTAAAPRSGCRPARSGPTGRERGGKTSSPARRAPRRGRIGARRAPACPRQYAAGTRPPAAATACWPGSSARPSCPRGGRGKS